MAYVIHLIIIIQKCVKHILNILPMDVVDVTSAAVDVASKDVTSNQDNCCYSSYGWG